MIKRVKFNKKIILVIIILLVLGFYIYKKNNNNYEQIETIAELEEVIVNEEEKDISLNNERGVDSNIDTETIGVEGKTEMIIVHITGEVNSWGVIELEAGARIIDAVNKAGGFTENADTNKVNLAYELSDGVKIYIPSKIEESATFEVQYITDNSGDNVIMEETEMKETKNELININRATQTELETLPGIGPSIALKIISYREENGNFSNIEDIKSVSGIGENKFDNIKELICV